MTTPNDPLLSLRKALTFSPDNIPLRQHLADILIDRGEAAAAANEYRQALVLDPQNADLKLGLAKAYNLEGKAASALTIVEDLLAHGENSSPILAFHSRLLASGDLHPTFLQFHPVPPPDTSARDADLLERLDLPHHQARFIPDPDGGGLFGREQGFARFIAYPDGADLVDRVGADSRFVSPQQQFDRRTAAESAEQDSQSDGDLFPEFSTDAEDLDTLDRSEVERTDEIERFVPYLDGKDRPSISFEDIAGLEDLKEELRLKIIYPLTHAELYRTYGRSIGGGVLLYGPPGCGKTHLARAVAGEIQAEFITIGLNEILDLWIGNSEKKLHQIFKRARKCQPCILFFDEIDALIENRTGANNSNGLRSMAQFLTELDAIHRANDMVFTIAATNAPWHLDEAFARTGRFDRVLLVPPPDITTRASILRLLCQGKPISEIDYSSLAQKTEGCSSRDLKQIVDLAVEQKLLIAMKTGIPHPLNTQDFVKAASGLKRTARKWFSTAGNYSHTNSVVRIFHR